MLEIRLTETEEELARELVEFGLKREKALKVVTTYPQKRVQQCIAYVKKQSPRNPAGYLLRALEEHRILPE